MSGDMLKSRPHTPTLAEPSCLMINDAAPPCSGTISWPSRYAPPLAESILKPELNAAIGSSRWSGGICEPHGLLPPPGCSVPTT